MTDYKLQSNLNQEVMKQATLGYSRRGGFNLMLNQYQETGLETATDVGWGNLRGLYALVYTP